MDGTPFAVEPWNDIFGLYGTTEAAEKHISGEYNLYTLGVSLEVLTWLEALIYDNGPPKPTKFNIINTHFQSAVKVCNKNTYT